MLIKHKLHYSRMCENFLTLNHELFKLGANFCALKDITRKSINAKTLCQVVTRQSLIELMSTRMPKKLKVFYEIWMHSILNWIMLLYFIYKSNNPLLSSFHLIVSIFLFYRHNLTRRKKVKKSIYQKQVTAEKLW